MKKWLPEKRKLYFTSSDIEIKSLDDVPLVAHIAARQRSLLKWYQVIAIAPFILVLFIVLKLFPNAAGRAWDFLIGASLLWAIGFAGYAFKLLFWGVRCPSCEQRFGARGDRCRSCDLPRHCASFSMSDLQNKVRLFEEE